ncbi:hypothetical protein JJB98_23690 [Bradyrhizobium diazoefficiens]|nr:hypothetical protein [Bradyrhizobium diazoefficiens]QQO22703.1 hypothetical protein JJB98_23690 [Bradyrhizobium diazoefficiens]
MEDRTAWRHELDTCESLLSFIRLHPVRGSGDALLMSPPLIISEKQIGDIVGAIHRALNTVD